MSRPSVGRIRMSVVAGFAPARAKRASHPVRFRKSMSPFAPRGFLTCVPRALSRRATASLSPRSWGTVRHPGVDPRLDSVSS